MKPQAPFKRPLHKPFGTRAPESQESLIERENHLLLELESARNRGDSQAISSLTLALRRLVD